MSTGNQVCEITIPGYTLTERIGSGGYAEVWRAEAPGGIEKAVKIVYGCYDDEFAAQELKSLERIKGVRHPFLLSLERFEVFNGRLAILTELADMSLDQRLVQCRADGLPGIPRDELLRYMADAAEALDFLSQRHQLLHLDIKPENLLVSGDHLKVADFGLVKELATRTQASLISGMTPTYAAPEMFDDEPSAFSDQYSLAIVYQQMLTGSLPFPGRTAAQLAKQHTQAEPQLMALPSADRPFVARALSKKPTDRYPSCKSFVDALLRRGSTISPAPAPMETPRPAPSAPHPKGPAPDDTKPPSFYTTIRRTPGLPVEQPGPTVTQPVSRSGQPLRAPDVEAAAIERLLPEIVVDIATPEIDAHLVSVQPTLFIAAGGLGTQILCRLRTLIAASGKFDDGELPFESIALDTDRDTLREACSRRWKAPMPPEDTLHLPLRLPKSYDDSREILGWLSRRWLYNIPRSLETRGYRPLGRIAVVDNHERVTSLIDQKLQKLGAIAGTKDAAGVPRDEKVRVVLLTGTGGGTGAGIVIDLANAARARATARNLPIEVQGFFVCTCYANNNSSPLVAANTYSLFTELKHATHFGNQSNGEKTMSNRTFDSGAPPFDCVYCIPARTRSKDAPTVDAVEITAKYLALEQVPGARAAIRSCRKSPSPREQEQGRGLVLKKLGYGSLTDLKLGLVHGLAIELAGEVKRHWLTPDTTADWGRLIQEEQQAAAAARSVETKEGEAGDPPAVARVNEGSPLALRARFNQFLTMGFASEMVRQIEELLVARDDRGRPLILVRDAKQIADTGRDVIAALSAHAKETAESHKLPAGVSRFSVSPLLRSLVTEASRRVLGAAVSKFDLKAPERFLPADLLDEIIESHCQQLLEERLTQPEIATAISGLMDLNAATAATVENASTDLLQCGSDRRTLVFVPKSEPQNEAAKKLQAARPLASVVPVDIDDVVVISEEAGVSPRSFGLALERVFPGIADAARRLLTRTDIDWQGLV